MEWQPIETAPKDGTIVDLWCMGGFRVANAKWETPRFDADEDEFTDAYKCWCVWRDAVQIDWDEWSHGLMKIETPPTHWMPLPEPPSDR